MPFPPKAGSSAGWMLTMRRGNARTSSAGMSFRYPEARETERQGERGSANAHATSWSLRGGSEDAGNCASRTGEDHEGDPELGQEARELRGGHPRLCESGAARPLAISSRKGFSQPGLAREAGGSGRCQTHQGDPWAADRRRRGCRSPWRSRRPHKSACRSQQPVLSAAGGGASVMGAQLLIRDAMRTHASPPRVQTHRYPAVDAPVQCRRVNLLEVRPATGDEDCRQ